MTEINENVIVNSEKLQPAAVLQIGSRLGLVTLIVTYVSLLAMGNVVTSHYLQHCDTFLMLWMVFGMVVVLFVSHALFRGPVQFSDVLQKNSKNIFLLNLSTMLSWVGGYYSFRYLEPAIGVSFTFAINPLLIIIFAYFAKPRQVTLAREFYCALCILAIMIYFVIISFQGLSSIGQVASTSSLMKGFLASFVSGIAVAGNTIYSKRLSQNRVSANDVMATRFYLLVTLALGVWCLGQDQLSHYLFSDYLAIVFVAIGGISIPLFLLQKVIERVSVMTVSFIIIFGPIGTYLFQSFDPRLHLSIYSFLGIGVVAMLIIIGSSSRYQKGVKNAN